MKKKQAIAFLLSTAMTTGTVLPVFGASNDISGHWAEATITKWQNDGKIGGYEDGTFKPDKTITRAEFVRLLNTATTTAFTSSANISFSDVSQSDWFFADVAKAVGSGVTSGFEDGTFRPSETVTRAQAAVFICKAKGIALDETRANLFADAAEIPAWAKGAVGAAVNAGYLSGYPDGTFGANKGMTRAEAVSTLDRLSGTANQPAEPNQGVSTPSERDDQKKEETTTANAGDMVWTSGGSGGSRRGSSSSGGSSSSSSSNTVSKNVTIRSQSDANDYKGKTLTGKATIYAKDGLELQDIRFKGDVDIIANSSAVAAAYTDGDVAVAANYLADIKIYFEGRTNVSGTITVIKEGVPVGTQVIITTRTPRAISAIVKAFIPTRIVGFEVPKVEASAPVEVASNAKVGTITADNGASVVAEGKVDKVNVVGKVDNIELSGTGSTDVTVNDGAKVEKIDVNGSVNADVTVKGNAEVKNVAVSDKASADVAVNDTATVGNVAVSDNAEAKVDVKDTAKVEKVDIADSAVVKVDVAPEAKVDAVTSTSTAPGSAVTGSGEVGKIEAPAGTMDKDDTITTPIVTPPATDDNKKPETGNVAVTGISLDKTTLSLKVDETATLTATVTPDNATDKTVTWTSDSDKVTVDEKGNLTAVAVTEADTPVIITAKAGDKTAECKVTVTAKADDPIVVEPADPTKADFVLEKLTDDSGYQLSTTDTGKYQYVLSADDKVPDDAAWKDLANAGTKILTADAEGMTHVHIRGVGEKDGEPDYGTITKAIKLDTAVTEVKVTSVTLSETELALKVGGAEADATATLTATVKPDDATNKVVTWESSDTTKVTVENGKVTAKAVTGTTPVTITAKAGEQTATCAVTVTAATQGEEVGADVKSVEGAEPGTSTITGLDTTKTYEYILTDKNTTTAADWTAEAIKTTAEGATKIDLAEKDIKGKTHIHIRVKAATGADANTAKAIELVVKADNTAKPDASSAKAQRDATTNTTVKVTGLSVTDGKTVEYYAAAAETTDFTKATWKPAGASDKGVYTITDVADTNTVIYFRYAEVPATSDAEKIPASDPSTAVTIDPATTKTELEATVTDTEIDFGAATVGKVTVTVANDKIEKPAAGTVSGELVFEANDTTPTKVTVELKAADITIPETTGDITIAFTPTKKTDTVAGFEAGKTYTLVSGSVSVKEGTAAEATKLFDIMPATPTAEKGITFTTKAANDDNVDKVAANVVVTENSAKDSIILTFTTDAEGKTAVEGLALAEEDTTLTLEATIDGAKVTYTTDKLTTTNATIEKTAGTVTIKKTEFKKDTTDFTKAAAGEYTLAIASGGFTSTATGESTAKAITPTISGIVTVESSGGGDDAAAKKAAATTEAKKITAFTAGSSSGTSYKLTATIDGTLSGVTAIDVVSVKQGTAATSNPDGNTGTDITGHGATMGANGDLTIPVATLVDATKIPDNASLYVTFKATKDSVESDPVTVEIAASETIASTDIAALRTDVAAIKAAATGLKATIAKANEATDITDSPTDLSCTIDNTAEVTLEDNNALNSTGKISKLALSIASKKLQITATLVSDGTLTTCEETNVEFTGVTLSSNGYTYEMTVPVAVKVTVTPA